MFYFNSFKHFALAVAEVSHMPDCHVFVGRQVGAAVMSQELVDFHLVGILGLECFCVDLHFLIGEGIDWLLHF